MVEAKNGHGTVEVVERTVHAVRSAALRRMVARR